MSLLSPPSAESLLAPPPPAGRTLTMPPGGMASILPPPPAATSPRTPEADVGFFTMNRAGMRATRSTSELANQRSGQSSPVTGLVKLSESPLQSLMRNGSTNQFERMAMSLTLTDVAETSLEMSVAVDPPLAFLPSTVNTPKASSTSTLGSLELTLYDTVSNGASVNMLQLPRSVDESPPPSVTTTEAGSFSERRTAHPLPN